MPKNTNNNGKRKVEEINNNNMFMEQQPPSIILAAGYYNNNNNNNNEVIIDRNMNNNMVVAADNNNNNNNNIDSFELSNNSNNNNNVEQQQQVFQVRITARKNEFTNRDHFWLVDLYAEPSLKQGATPLVRRCMKVYGWDELYCRKVLKAYKQFLHIKERKRDWNAVLLSPSIDVYEMWQQHILDVNNYIHDCMLLCGHVLGHNPDDNGSMHRTSSIHNNINNSTTSNSTGASSSTHTNSTKKGCRYTRTRMALEEYFDESELDKSIDGVWKEIFHNRDNIGNITNNIYDDTNRNSSNDGDDDSNQSISIVIRHTHADTNDTDESYYNIKLRTPFGMVFETYAQRTNVPLSNLRFHYQDQRIYSYTTPKVMLQQQPDDVEQPPTDRHIDHDDEDDDLDESTNAVVRVPQQQPPQMYVITCSHV